MLRKEIIEKINKHPVAAAYFYRYDDNAIYFIGKRGGLFSGRYDEIDKLIEAVENSVKKCSDYFKKAGFNHKDISGFSIDEYGRVFIDGKNIRRRGNYILSISESKEDEFGNAFYLFDKSENLEQFAYGIGYNPIKINHNMFVAIPSEILNEIKSK